jgi:hypothetical protein
VCHHVSNSVRRLAQDLDIRTQAFIDGEYVDAASVEIGRRRRNSRRFVCGVGVLQMRWLRLRYDCI